MIKPSHLWLTVLLALTVFPGATCRSNSSTTTRTELRFKDITVNKLRANPGDEIVITWNYDAQERLQKQSFRFLAVFFTGFMEDARELEVSKRELRFPFNQPVTVELVAESNEAGKGDKVSFSIEYADDFVIEATANLSAAAGYPVLDGVDGPLRFIHVQGFYDANADGVINSLALDPVMSTMFERDSGFYALTYPFQERANGTFPMKRGRNFPLLSSNFLNTNDIYAPGKKYRDQFVPRGITNADAIVFGGAVKFSGEKVTIKTDAGENVAFRGVSQYDPIFITLVFRSRDDDNQNAVDPLVISEIQLGHMEKGLVVHLYQWDMTPDPRAIGAYQAGYGEQPGGYYAAHGSFQQANLAMMFTPLSGVPLTSVVALEKVRWRVPFISDQDLLPESNCDDGLDNDGDTFQDCRDPACLGQQCRVGFCANDGTCRP